LDTLLWGLVPYWSKHDKTAFINARAERIDTPPAFSPRFSKTPMLNSGPMAFTSGRKHLRENSLLDRNERWFHFCFRGSLDGWQHPHTKEWLRTCVIITGELNELFARIHTRMPVILPPETHERWLSEEFGKETLRPFPAKEITARMISKRINKPENNDPSVLEEGEMEQAGRLI
jgi:putative SOS response-associated peptidase YedK